MEFWDGFLNNRILLSALIGWFVAQVLKTLIDLFINKSFHPERLIGAGGMPSSHSATVCALATAAYLEFGIASSEFAISFVLSMIVMHDATGVRRETGRQAVLLNTFMTQYPLKKNNKDFETKLKEYIGHSPMQVLAGGILGCLIAILIEYIV